VSFLRQKIWDVFYDPRGIYIFIRLERAASKKANNKNNNKQTLTKQTGIYASQHVFDQLNVEARLNCSRSKLTAVSFDLLQFSRLSILNCVHQLNAFDCVVLADHLPGHIAPGDYPLGENLKTGINPYF